MISDYTPVSLALERAALLLVAQDDLHDWPDQTEAAKAWETIRLGLVAMGGLGLVISTQGRPYILYELYPDDLVYLGRCGDGQGDRFAATREGATYIPLSERFRSISREPTPRFPSLPFLCPCPF